MLRSLVLHQASEFFPVLAPGNFFLTSARIASSRLDAGSDLVGLARARVDGGDAQQPVTALLIARAIGYALAYLIHRR
jgi:hypothetical protein